MVRLPTPGSDHGTWGEILNEFLSQSLKTDGTLQENVVTSNNIAPNSVTNTALATDAVNATIIADGSITEALLELSLQTKINSPSPVTSVAGKTGDVTLLKSDVGLTDVDNTSDATKNSANATLTNKTISGSSNTITNIAQSSVVNLTSDLASKAADSTVVHNTGSETIAGAKTFTSSVFLGDGTSSAYLTIQGTAYNGVDTNVYSDSASPYSFFRRYKGTKLSPTQVTSGSYLGSFGFRAANETGATNPQDGARFSAVADEDVTSTSQATSLVFYTAASGTVSPAERMRIRGDGDVRVLSPGTNSSSIVTVGAPQVMTNKTLTNPTVNDYTEGVVSLGVVTTTCTISLSSGTIITATLTASTSCTFTMPTATAGKSFTLFLKQSPVTGNGSAVFSLVKWGAGGAPVITTDSGKMDILSFFSDGTNWYGQYAQGYTP